MSKVKNQTAGRPPFLAGYPLRYRPSLSLARKPSDSFSDLLCVRYKTLQPFPLPPVLFPTLRTPSTRCSLSPLAHACCDFYRQCHAAASRSFLITGRPNRVAHPNTAGRHSSRSVSLAVTRLPLLSRHPRRLAQPSFIRHSERSTSEPLQRSHRKSYPSQPAITSLPPNTRHLL